MSRLSDVGERVEDKSLLLKSSSGDRSWIQDGAGLQEHT